MQLLGRIWRAIVLPAWTSLTRPSLLWNDIMIMIMIMIICKAAPVLKLETTAFLGVEGQL